MGFIDRCKKLINNEYLKALRNIIYTMFITIFVFTMPLLNLLMLIATIILLILFLFRSKHNNVKITGIVILIISVLLGIYFPNYVIKISIEYNYTIILLIYAILTTDSIIIETYKEEIKELFKWKTKWDELDPLQISSQNYLFILSIVLSISVSIILIILNNMNKLDLNSILSLIFSLLPSLFSLPDILFSYPTNNPISDFMTLAGVLGAIVSILISFSWLVIQTSTNNQNNILMWIWVRDPRFITFTYISFSTVFLLIILSLTRAPLHRLDYGIIYLIIFLNFLMYVLYIKAFSNVINPKHTVDLILRFKKDKDENKNKKSDLLDAESRLLAVYDIIKKGIYNRDVYLVVKCLNMIYENFEDYWVFKDKNHIYKFLDMLRKLKKLYKKKCRKEFYYYRGLNAFKELIKKCNEKLIKNNIK